MYMLSRNHYQDMNSLWNSFFAPFTEDMTADRAFRVDVQETDDSYQLEAELPGVSEDQISVQVDHDILTISADVNMDKQDKQYMHSERRWGHMERSFELEGVDQDGIRASLDNGILRIMLPKIHPVTQEVRKIAIGHAGSDTPKLAEGSGECENRNDQA